MKFFVLMTKGVTVVPSNTPPASISMPKDKDQPKGQNRERCCPNACARVRRRRTGEEKGHFPRAGYPGFPTFPAASH